MKEEQYYDKENIVLELGDMSDTQNIIVKKDSY